MAHDSLIEAVGSRVNLEVVYLNKRCNTPSLGFVFLGGISMQ